MQLACMYMENTYHKKFGHAWRRAAGRLDMPRLEAAVGRPHVDITRILYIVVTNTTASVMHIIQKYA